MCTFRKYPALSICMVCHHQDRCALEMFEMLLHVHKVRKRTKIRNHYNQVPHLTQDINGKVRNSLLDITNESQEVSPFPAGDHKASINGRALTTRHQQTDAHESITNTCKTKIHKRSTAFKRSCSFSVP